MCSRVPRSSCGEQVSPAEALTAIAIGFGAGILSGMFGVGGGIVMTPAIQIALGTAPIVSLATPLPAIFPTAIAGALRYRRAGELDLPAAARLAAGGVPAAILGAGLTDVVATQLLLLVTAGLLGWQALGVMRGRTPSGEPAEVSAKPAAFVLVGVLAGLVSGLLGIGGGIVMVPLMVGRLGVPLKRALGTSLAAIVLMVVPGSIVHAALGNVDWPTCVALAIGAVPGARVGSHIALGTAERRLRSMVGGSMLVIALAYGLRQLFEYLGS